MENLVPEEPQEAQIPNGVPRAEDAPSTRKPKWGTWCWKSPKKRKIPYGTSGPGEPQELRDTKWNIQPWRNPKNQRPQRGTQCWRNPKNQRPQRGTQCRRNPKNQRPQRGTQPWRSPKNQRPQWGTQPWRSPKHGGPPMAHPMRQDPRGHQERSSAPRSRVPHRWDFGEAHPTWRPSTPLTSATFALRSQLHHDGGGCEQQKHRNVPWGGGEGGTRPLPVGIPSTLV